MYYVVSIVSLEESNDNLSEEDVEKVERKTRQMKETKTAEFPVSKKQGKVNWPHSLKHQPRICWAKHHFATRYFTNRWQQLLFIGTARFLASHKQLLSLSTAAESSADAICNKDTGAKQKCLQKWSRGLLHFVRGGGHIDSWSPLYV